MSVHSSSPLSSRPSDLRVEPFGESAVIVLLGGGIDEAGYRQLAALSKAIQANPPLGFAELVPAYNSLLIVFNPVISDTTTMTAAVRALASAQPNLAVDAAKDIIDLPVAYGGEYGPDLESVAANAGLSAEEIIAIHSSKPYLVYMLGFTPGFPYLGGMDQRIATPRLKTPRTKVPAGSIGIADAQTGVYPLESPGGWNLIGRTPMALFDPGRQPPALLSPGKYVRFTPIKHDDFEILRKPGAAQQTNTAPGEDQQTNTAPGEDQQTNTVPGEDQLKSSRKPGTGSVIEPAAEDGSAPARNITVLKPGALSTVQDSGRFGYQATGVPPSGPMDGYSMNLANMLAGNQLDAACIECTLGGLELRFGSDSVFALAGAGTPAFLDDNPVPMHRTLRAKSGMVLRLGMASAGLRTYFAVNGGIAVPMVMGSRATFLRGGFGGFEGRALAAGDRLPVGSPSELLPGSNTGSSIPDRFVPQGLIPSFPQEIAVRAIPSHETERFTADGLKCFFSASYSVSQKSDRMGCRLEGRAIEHTSGADIISSGVQTGTVQVPGDGQPIVLMADRQTTGGYTRIAQVIQADLPLLGQARPGDTVRFIQSRPTEAAKALAVQLDYLQQVGNSILMPTSLLGMNPGVPSRMTRLFHVYINDQSYSVTVEEVF